VGADNLEDMVISIVSAAFAAAVREGTPGLVGLRVSRIATSVAGALTAADVKDFAGHEGGRFEVKDRLQPAGCSIRT
jgi:hypothetical protein